MSLIGRRVKVVTIDVTDALDKVAACRSALDELSARHGYETSSSSSSGCPWCHREDRHEPHRIDPRDCGCTDCICGWSRPLDEASDDQLWALLMGRVENATYTTVEAARAAVAAGSCLLAAFDPWEVDQS